MWSEQEIRQFLDNYPELAYKYGFLIKDNLPGENFLELMLKLTKSITSMYCEFVFNDVSIDINLMLAQSISEFVSARIEDITLTQSINENLDWTRDNILDIYLGCPNEIEIDNDFMAGKLDFLCFKLIIITMLFYKVTKFKLASLPQGYVCTLLESDFLNIKNIIMNKEHKLFMAISFWGNVNISVNEKDLSILIERR